MIRLATLSGQSLKKNLMKLLTDIRTDTCAHQYCGLILRAKQIIDPSLSIPSTKFCENITTINDIFLQTKQLMYKYDDRHDSYSRGCSTAEEIVTRLRNTILCSDSTPNPSDSIEPLLRLLLGMRRHYHQVNIFSDDHGVVGEYVIKRLITATDWFLISRGDTNSFFEPPTPEQAVENLKNVRSKLAKYSSYKAEDLLSTVFHIGRTRLDFSEEEKTEIGTLMMKAIEPIQMCIEGVSCFPDRTLSSVLQKRSSLQFLVDDYAEFPTQKRKDVDEFTKKPAENEALRKEFYEERIIDSIKHVDNVIRVWCDYLGEGKAVENEVGSRVLDNDMTKWCEDAKDFEEAGASEVPKSHIWWSDSITKCITKNKN